MQQVPNPQKTAVKSEEDVHRGPLKDYEKSQKNESATMEKEPLAKKRRIDDESVNSIDSKLNEIRNSMPSADQPIEISDASVEESPKKKRGKGKNKNKNKKKNQPTQPTTANDNQSDFDYANVDFKKFGGGSINEHKNEIKMKFHGKVRVGFFMLKHLSISDLFQDHLVKICFVFGFLFQGKNNKANKRFMNMLSKSTSNKK